MCSLRSKVSSSWCQKEWLRYAQQKPRCPENSCSLIVKIDKFVCEHTVCIYIYICVCVCVYVYICMYMYIYVFIVCIVYIYIYTHIYIYTCMYTYTYIYCYYPNHQNKLKSRCISSNDANDKGPILFPIFEEYARQSQS